MHKRAFPQLQDRHRPQHSKRLECASGGELVQRFDGLDGLTYQGDISNAPATVSVLNSSTISTVELVDLRGGARRRLRSIWLVVAAIASQEFDRRTATSWPHP